MADHFPEELVASGPADKTLAMIKVSADEESDALATLVKRWGNPWHYKEAPADGVPVFGGEAEYSWRREGIDIEIATGWHFDTEGRRVETVTSASIRGNTSSPPLCSQRGVCLGDPMAKVRAKYGDRFARGRSKDGDYLRFAFRDETMIEFMLDEKERVSQISLIPSVE